MDSIVYTQCPLTKTYETLSRGTFINQPAKVTNPPSALLSDLQLLATVLSQSAKAKEHLMEQTKSVEQPPGRTPGTLVPV